MPREFVRTKARHLEDAFHFNVSTAHALTHAAVPLILEGREPGGPTGAVVNISSVMGRVSGRGYLAYGTAKGALSHYTELAARDLAPRIRVNAISVGSVATSALELVLDDEASRTQMEQSTPLQRIGHPDDIAATVLFLASDAGRVRHRQGHRGRRRARPAQPRPRASPTSEPSAEPGARRRRSPAQTDSVAPVVRLSANQSSVRIQASSAASAT